VRDCGATGFTVVSELLHESETAAVASTVTFRGATQVSLLPCLTHGGRRRAQVEGVRVSAEQRGRGVGADLLRWTIDWARDQGCGVVQLTTDKRRPEALSFYESLGFTASHEGLKLVVEPVDLA